MNNSTDLNLWGYTSQDLEIANLVQGGCSLVATFIILVRVLDIPSFFKSVRERRAIHKKNKERKELEKIKKLMENLNNKNLDLEEILLSDDEESSNNNNHNYKIAHKKKGSTLNSAESKV